MHAGGDVWLGWADKVLGLNDPVKFLQQLYCWMGAMLNVHVYVRNYICLACLGSLANEMKPHDKTSDCKLGGSHVIETLEGFIVDALQHAAHKHMKE